MRLRACSAKLRWRPGGRTSAETESNFKLLDSICDSNSTVRIHLDDTVDLRVPTRLFKNNATLITPALQNSNDNKSATCAGTDSLTLKHTSPRRSLSPWILTGLSKYEPCFNSAIYQSASPTKVASEHFDAHHSSRRFSWRSLKIALVMNHPQLSHLRPSLQKPYFCPL